MRAYTNNSGSTQRQRGSSHRRVRLGWRAAQAGFTLLELMVVITVMMILIAVAVPAYNQHIIQARESVLRSNLQELDKVIQQYTLDKGQAPQSLEDLVTANYLREIPKDPMTGTADWDTDQEDPTAAADPQQPGIAGVHSHATGTALDGTAYSTWK
jgi:general secretion pathway protein G